MHLPKWSLGFGFVDFFGVGIGMGGLEQPEQPENMDRKVGKL